MLIVRLIFAIITAGSGILYSLGSLLEAWICVFLGAILGTKVDLKRGKFIPGTLIASWACNSQARCSRDCYL